MNTCIALFRGINVGGNNLLPMKDLVRLLERLGARQARTYIQSGNAVFQIEKKEAGDFPRRLAGKIRKRHGFEPQLLVIDRPALEQAIAENPFPEAESRPATLHLGFLGYAPRNPDIAKLDALKKPNERWIIRGAVFYLDAPEGIGRSRLATGAEKAIGVAMTLRNWNTVRAIRALAEKLTD